MPARTGQEYIAGLKERPREVWLNGECVKDVTEHPALRNGVRSVAALYDLQHTPPKSPPARGGMEGSPSGRGGMEGGVEMTFASPTTGEPVGLSFLVPKTIDDLVRRREMMTRWAWASCGMMGRSPDFMNTIFSAWAGSAGYYAQDRPEFKKNMLNYHEFIRENDVTLTHALVNLQRRRHQGPTDILHEDVALTMVKETDAGIVVKGSRTLATLGPISDEIAIYPVASHRLDDEAKRQTFSFSIPCDTPGVKFLCRESFDYGRSHFNHPLGSRFEEMDTVVFFDNVLVPWERVFLLGNVELGNGYAAGTQSDSHTGHQVLNRCLVKSEFILGLADLIVDTLGSGSIPHVQEQVAELINYRDVLRACVRAAEADAKLNQYGMMCPDMNAIRAGRTLFGRSMFPRMVEIIQLLGTGGLMALPAEADFDSDIGAEIERYFATDSSDARERARLFHLAWDASCSAFSGRQVLYERMFGGNPVRNSITLFQNYDKEPFKAKVRQFLEQEDWP